MRTTSCCAVSFTCPCGAPSRSRERRRSALVLAGSVLGWPMRLLRLVPMCVLLAAACPAEDDADSGADGPTTGPEGSGSTSSTGASTSATMTTGATMTTAATTTEPGTETGPAETSSGDTTTDAPGTETTPADTGSTGEPSDPCAAAPEDTECDSCVKGACCAQLTDCAEDPECVCFQDCAASMPPSINVPMICGDMCGIATPFAHPTVGQVLTCSIRCSGVCL